MTQRDMNRACVARVVNTTTLVCYVALASTVQKPAPVWFELASLVTLVLLLGCWKFIAADAFKTGRISRDAEMLASASVQVGSAKLHGVVVLVSLLLFALYVPWAWLLGCHFLKHSVAVVWCVAALVAFMPSAYFIALQWFSRREQLSGAAEGASDTPSCLRLEPRADRRYRAGEELAFAAADIVWLTYVGACVHMDRVVGAMTVCAALGAAWYLKSARDEWRS